MPDTVPVTVTVNGSTHERDVEPRTLLVHFLREELDLTGAHVGCESTLCGACTVHPQRSRREELHRPGGSGRRPRK